MSRAVFKFIEGGNNIRPNGRGTDSFSIYSLQE